MARWAPGFFALLAAGAMALGSTGCRRETVRTQSQPEVSEPVAKVTAAQAEINLLIADLGVSKGGLRAPYCMPFPRSRADDAYGRLLKIGRPAVPMLIKGLDSPNTYRRAHCAGLLGEIGDKRAVEPLCKILSSEVDAKSWIIHALGRLRDERAIEPLMKLLPEGSGVIHSIPMSVPTTGRMAAEALAQIGPAAKPRLEAALNSRDACVRANARYALDRMKKG